MKKIKITVLSLVALIFASGAMAQPVSDNAVIPIGVTVNKILRLTILTGGNQEFVFTSMDKFKTGLADATASEYNTTLTVASSGDWYLQWKGEDASLLSNDGGTADMGWDNLGMYIQTTGTYTIPQTIGSSYCNAGSEVVPTNAWVTLMTTSTGAGQPGNGGDGDDNAFTFHWSCGTGAGQLTDGSFIKQNFDAGRYSSNVLLRLIAH